MCSPSFLAEVVGKKTGPDGTHTSSSQRHVFPHILVLYRHGQNVESLTGLYLSSCLVGYFQKREQPVMRQGHMRLYRMFVKLLCLSLFFPVSPVKSAEVKGNHSPLFVAHYCNRSVQVSLWFHLHIYYLFP